MQNLFRKLRLIKKGYDKVTFASEEQFNEQTNRYIDEINQENRVAVSESIEEEKDMQIEMLARERAINDLAANPEYTADNILVIKDPYGYVPLSALAIFSTTKPLKSKVWVAGSKDTIMKGELPACYNHRIPIFGLYADTVNKVIIELYTPENERVRTIQFQIETGGLPSSCQDLATIIKSNEKTKYPFYYISGVDVWFPTIIDSEGKVRYYIKKPSKNYGVFPMSGGMMFHCERDISRASFGAPHASVAYEMDLWGRIRKTYNIKNGVHHDVYEIGPGGNLLIATSSLEKYCEDVVAEIDRVTGLTVKEVKMDDIITEPSVKDSTDWAHMNTVSYNRQDNSVLVCLRNLHSVLKIDWTTGKLLWILGDPFFWKGTTMEKYVLTPEHDDIQWFYQAHASYQLDKKPGDDPDILRIMLYDNHYQSRRQTDNFDDDKHSYGNIYFVNTKTNTVRLHKRFKSKKSTVRSNAVYDGDNNRFLMMSGCLQKNYDGAAGLIYEYSYYNKALKNMIGIAKKFYRAYPMTINFDSLAERISTDPVVVGDYFYPEACETPDVANAVPLPFVEKKEAKLKEERTMKTRKQKEEEWEKMMQGRKWEDLDHTERIGSTSFTIKGTNMYMYAIDHMVSHLYMVGENNTYCMDYTSTYQELLAVFYNYGYKMTVPIDRLPKDRYHLYVNCMGTLYDTGKEFTIKE